jgi:PAS domain S-box-containing protein
MLSTLAVLRSSSCFEQAIIQIPLALAIMDNDRRILYANPQASTLFGCPESEMLGQHIGLLVPQGQMDWGAPVNGPLAREMFGLHRDGTQIPIEVTVSGLASPSGSLILALFQDLSARRRADAVERQMSAIVESAEDAILTKSLDGVIQSWNPGAERLLGYSAQEVIGGPITRLIPADLEDEEGLILSQLRKGRRVAHFQTRRRKKDGSDVDVSLTISPVRDRAGVIVGASKIMRDVSDRKLAEETLGRSNAELQRLNLELDEFVYTASHDLRSPLTNVDSLAQWILDDDESLSVETRDRLLLIQGRIQRMKQLLNDIREYALSGSAQEIAGPSLSASALLVDIIASVGVPPGFSVVVEAALADVPVKRIPLIQVFHNLIGNAIKHHDRKIGTITVSVDSNGSMLRFVVRDDGPGVPPQYREAIFSMFKMLKPRDQVEGSGMGLALVRKIVSRMGGACGVESAIARGAGFWFDWPKLPDVADLHLDAH